MERLSSILSKMRSPSGAITTCLADLQQKMKDQSFGFWIILVSLPSALPMPAPGYSTPLGLLLFWMGTLLFRKKPIIVFPENIGKKPFTLPSKCVTCGIKMLAFLEYFVRPQRCIWIGKLLNKKIIGINICILALIMALPIPLTNTAPAGVILLFGLALLEHDGILLFFCQLLAIFLISLYVFAFTWAVTFGVESLQSLIRTCISWTKC